MQKLVVILLFVLVQSSYAVSLPSMALHVEDTKVAVDISHIDLDEKAYKVKVSHDGTKAFIASRKGISIVDVSELLKPRMLSSIDAAIYFNGTAESGTNNFTLSKDETKLYLITAKELRVYDISDVLHPQLLSSVTNTNGDDLRAIVLNSDETRAYVVSELVFDIFDISDLNNVSQINYSTTTGNTILINSARDIQISDNQNYLYIASDYHRLVILDIQSSDAPQEVYRDTSSVTRIGEYATLKLSHDNSVVFKSNSEDYAVTLHNVSTPTTPTLISTISQSSKVTSVAITQDESKLVLSTQKGVGIYDISDMSSPSLLNFIEFTSINNITLLDNDKTLLCVGNNGTLYTIDISTPLSPRTIGNAPYIQGSNSQIFLNSDGTKAYVSSSTSGIALLDIGNIDNIQTPTYYGGYSSSDLYTKAMTMNEARTKAYICNKEYVYNGGDSYYQGDGIVVVDTSSNTMSILSSFDVSAPIQQMKLSTDESKLYVRDTDSFKIMELNATNVLSVLDEYNISTYTSYRTDFALSHDGKKVFIREKALSGDSDKIEVLDVSDAQNITSVMSYDANSIGDLYTFMKDNNVTCEDVHVRDNAKMIYTNSGEIYDVNQSGEPQLIGSFPVSNGSVSAFALSQDASILFSVNNTLGLEIIDVTPTLYLPRDFGTYNLKLDISSLVDDVLSVTLSENNSSLVTIASTQSSFSIVADETKSLSIPIGSITSQTGMIKLDINISGNSGSITKSIYIKVFDTQGSIVAANKGWSLLGTDRVTPVQSIFCSGAHVQSLWKYKNGTWLLKTDIANSFGYQSFETIGANEGFWVNCTE